MRRIQGRDHAVATESPESRLAEFGPNEWLVDEIYEQFLADRSSVDPAWWEFFEGYTPPDYSPVGSSRVTSTPDEPTVVVTAPPTIRSSRTDPTIACDLPGKRRVPE